MASVSPCTCGLYADDPKAALDDKSARFQCWEQMPSSSWQRRHRSASAWSASEGNAVHWPRASPSSTKRIRSKTSYSRTNQGTAVRMRPTTAMA